MAEVAKLKVACERRDDDVVVIATSGELDLATVGQLAATLQAPDARAQTVVLDLRGLRFIDSSGLSAIVAQQQRAATEHFRFVVAVGEGTAVERLLDLSGLRGTLEITGDPTALLAR